MRLIEPVSEIPENQERGHLHEICQEFIASGVEYALVKDGRRIVAHNLKVIADRYYIRVHTRDTGIYLERLKK